MVYTNIKDDRWNKQFKYFTISKVKWTLEVKENLFLLFLKGLSIDQIKPASLETSEITFIKALNKKWKFTGKL